MTVEEYLQSLVIGLSSVPDFDKVYMRAARSPKEVGLAALNLSEDIDDAEEFDENYQARLDYAASTVYYSVLGICSGGGYSEKFGNVQTTLSGITLTKDDRKRFKELADALRHKHGFDVEEDSTDSEGAFDATALRYTDLEL
jgi:hypothetical protein